MENATLLCSRLEAPTRMFTCDKAYRVTPGFSDRLLRVVDDRGHERFISRDTLRFIVGHKDADRYGVTAPLYAYFRFAFGENP